MRLPASGRHYRAMQNGPAFAGPFRFTHARHGLALLHLRAVCRQLAQALHRD